MLKRMGSKRRPQRERLFVVANQQIRFPELRVMDEWGQSLGVLSREEAWQKAQESDKDLILVTDKANPPVAKIIELSKYRYQVSQKKAQDRKKNRVQDIKEIRLTPFIGENDLQAKLRKAMEFIKHNDKVRLSMELRGRNITKQDIAKEILDRVVEELAPIAQVEVPAKLLGKKLQLQLMPVKKGNKNQTQTEEKD